MPPRIHDLAPSVAGRDMPDTDLVQRRRHQPALALRERAAG